MDEQNRRYKWANGQKIKFACEAISNIHGWGTIVTSPIAYRYRISDCAIAATLELAISVERVFSRLFVHFPFRLLPGTPRCSPPPPRCRQYCRKGQLKIFHVLTFFVLVVVLFLSISLLALGIAPALDCICSNVCRCA